MQLPEPDQRFMLVVNELVELHRRKAADYGTDDDLLANLKASEAFGIPAWLGTIIRGNDKVRRIQAFARKGNLANESLRDSLIDLAAYAILAVALFDEAKS